MTVSRRGMTPSRSSSHAHLRRSRTDHGGAGATSRTARVALDRVLELVGRRRLSAAELRILLRLVDRDAGIPELAEALDERTVDVRRCGRRLSARGLVRWRHAGTRKETRLGITPAGLTTVRALLTAAGGVAVGGEPEAVIQSERRGVTAAPHVDDRRAA